MLGEDEMVRFLAGRFRAGGRVRVGIGDDAAVLAGDARRDWVVTTDLMVEGVHFRRELQLARAVGWKALARSLSDIAAMGAVPRTALVALAVPAATPTVWVKDFFAGLAALARRFHVCVIGGDLSSAAQIVADVQVLGEVERGRALRRRGARPGDLIYVSGTLGLSHLGLLCLCHHVAAARPLLQRAVRAFCQPKPRLELARVLHPFGVTTLMDLSDGLSTDLHRLCEASGVGARIFADKIPTVELPPLLARRLKTTALNLALHGGEDYELLFTVPKSRAARLPRRLANVRLTSIGQITRPRRLVLVEPRGRTHRLAPRGWDHFRHST